jgi:hypothetical protein
MGNVHEELWMLQERIPPFGFTSLIVSSFPSLFKAFAEKSFALLWRGTRDDFSACAFHRRCDGHPNTLTLILDTDGNIFGGFTPVEWESRPNAPHAAADPAKMSVLFSLKNPHKSEEEQFPLKPEKANEAICCHSSWGPHFG